MIRRSDFQTTSNDINSLDQKRFIDKEGTNPGSELTGRYFNDIQDGYLATMDFVGMQPDGSSEIGRTGQILEMNKRMAFVMANPVMSLKIQYPGLPSPSDLPNNYAIWFDVSHLEIFAGAFTRFQDSRENASTSSTPPKVARNFAGQTIPEYSGAPNIRGVANIEFLVDDSNLNLSGAFKQTFVVEEVSQTKALPEGTPSSNRVHLIFDAADTNEDTAKIYLNSNREVRPLNITTIPWLCVGYTWEQTKVNEFSNVNNKFIQLDRIYELAGITKPEGV